MTVGELFEHLMTMPSSAEIIFEDCKGQLFSIDRAVLEEDTLGATVVLCESPGE